MLTLADATLKETTPLLVRAGFVQQRGRKSVTAIEEVIVDLAGDSSNLEYSMVANYDEEVESPTNISFREEVDEKALKQFYADIDKIKNEESYLDQNKADTGKAALEVVSKNEMLKSQCCLMSVIRS